MEASSAKLREKARQYEAIAAGHEKAHGEALVDFGRKRFEGQDCGPHEEFGSSDERGERYCESPEPARLAHMMGVSVPPPSTLSVGTSVDWSTGHLASDVVTMCDGPGAGGYDSTTARGSAQQSPLAADRPMHQDFRQAGIRQAFERPRTSQEDLVHLDRLRAETEHCRDTIGQDRRQSRDAIRQRLAMLREAKADVLE